MARTLRFQLRFWVEMLAVVLLKLRVEYNLARVGTFKMFWKCFFRVFCGWYMCVITGLRETLQAKLSGWEVLTVFDFPLLIKYLRCIDQTLGIDHTLVDYDIRALNYRWHRQFRVKKILLHILLTWFYRVELITKVIKFFSIVCQTPCGNPLCRLLIRLGLQFIFDWRNHTCLLLFSNLQFPVGGAKVLLQNGVVAQVTFWFVAVRGDERLVNKRFLECLTKTFVEWQASRLIFILRLYVFAHFLSRDVHWLNYPRAF